MTARKEKFLKGQARSALNKAARPVPPGPLQQYLNEKSNPDDAAAALRILKALDIPLPGKNEFVQGTDGALIFDNRHGVVIRIEKQQALETTKTRFNDHPLVLQPLGSYRAGEMVVEICPGTPTAYDIAPVEKLSNAFFESGMIFWDAGIRNIGFLPLRLPGYEDGVPVVIDRSAVMELDAGTADIKKALESMGLKKDPQRELYGPLRRKLAAALPDANSAPNPAAVAEFWKACKDAVKNGILETGWRDALFDGLDQPERTEQAVSSARAYQKRCSMIRQLSR